MPKKRKREETPSQKSKMRRVEEQWWDENDGDWYKDRDDQSWYQWDDEKQLWFWQAGDEEWRCARGDSPRDTDYDEWLYYQDDAIREEEIRGLAYKEIREFFQKNFQYSEYRDRPKGNEKLVPAHNYVEAQLQGKGKKKVTDEERRSHNVVLGSIRFYNEKEEKIGKLKIRDDTYPSMNFNMRFSQDEGGLRQAHSYKEAVESMDDNLKKLIDRRPEVLQEESKQPNQNRVYGVIFDKIKTSLDRRKSYYEEDDIYKAIFQIRNHSEEALFEYVQSENFRKKFFDKIQSLSDKDLNKIKISLYSTKESCHICQVTLRALKEFIKESLVEIEISTYQEEDAPLIPKMYLESQIPEVTLHLSSQEKTTPVSGLKVSGDLSPLQSRAQEEDVDIKGNRERRNKYTVFYNDIKKELHVLSDREASSAHYAELNKKFEQQERRIEKQDKEILKMKEQMQQMQQLLQSRSTQSSSSSRESRDQQDQSWGSRVKKDDNPESKNSGR